MRYQASGILASNRLGCIDSAFTQELHLLVKLPPAAFCALPGCQACYRGEAGGAQTAPQALRRLHSHCRWVGVLGLQLVLQDVQEGLCALKPCISSFVLEQLPGHLQECGLGHLGNHAPLLLAQPHDLAVTQVAEATVGTGLAPPPCHQVHTRTLAEHRMPQAADADLPFVLLAGHLHALKWSLRALRPKVSSLRCRGKAGKRAHVSVHLSLFRGLGRATTKRRSAACTAGARVLGPLLAFQEHVQKGKAVGHLRHALALLSTWRKTKVIVVAT